MIAATNRRPEEAVAKGKLREDLHYRLNVFPISLPPLRDRREDVELLAQHFLAALNKEHDTAKEFTRPAVNRLKSHNWPGNVRELKNLVHRAFILADEHIGLDALPWRAGESAPASTSGRRRSARPAPLDPGHVETACVMAMAAEVLGISLKTLQPAERIQDGLRARSPRRAASRGRGCHPERACVGALPAGRPTPERRRARGSR